jgi:hypothetical protein
VPLALEPITDYPTTSLTPPLGQFAFTCQSAVTEFQDALQDINAVLHKRAFKVSLVF